VPVIQNLLLEKLCKSLLTNQSFPLKIRIKDTKSIPDKATMAYYLKPLTYNSQVAGYLIRMYPNQWSTIDAFSNQVLSQIDDEDILVRGTNTPDLRASGRLVQKSVDVRAIQARKNQ